MFFSSVVPKIEHISQAEASKHWIKKKEKNMSVVHMVHLVNPSWIGLVFFAAIPCIK